MMVRVMLPMSKVDPSRPETIPKFVDPVYIPPTLRPSEARPTVCDAKWRRCSIGTGLRFWGMIELICTKAFGT